MRDLNENIRLLQDACKNPKARLDYYLSQGKKVIGCFAPYTPEELIHASGMIPMGLWGGHTEIKLAASYLPAFACPIMQANMEYGLNGTYTGLSAIVIPAICDTLRCMTQNFRFGVKQIPMIPIVYPQNRESEASIDYLVSEYEHLLVALSTITGQMMSEAALKETINIYNEHNAVMREFSDIAAKHLDVITPVVRHAVMKSAMFYEKSEHTAIVKEINEALKAMPEYDFKGVKVILSGITAEPDGLLELLSECNMAVVGDDLAQEMRQYRTDTPESSAGGLKRLAYQWKNRYGCSLIHEIGKPRGKMLADMCRKEDAQAVIICLMKFCDPEEYDAPYIVKDVRKEGIQCLTIDIDPLNSSFEQTRTKLQTLSEIL